jgi:hypothetical protein
MSDSSLCNFLLLVIAVMTGHFLYNRLSACPVSNYAPVSASRVQTGPVPQVYGYAPVSKSTSPRVQSTQVPPNAQANPRPLQRASGFQVPIDNWELSETGQEFQSAAQHLAPHLADPRKHLLPERSRQSLEGNPRKTPISDDPTEQKIDQEFEKHAITVQDIQQATAKAGMLRHRTLTTRGTRTLGSTLLLRQAVQPQMPHPIGLGPHDWLDSSHRLDRVEDARPVQDVAQAHCWQG